MKTISLLCLTTAVSALAQTSAQDHHKALGPLFNAAPFVAKPSGPKLGLDSVHRWNQIAIDASGLDHTPIGPGETRVFGEQLGPGRSSRAMAIVHIAIFDAVDAIIQRYESYTGVQARHGAVSLDAAVAQAAHDTLVPLYPSQASSFDSFLADDLAKINNIPAKAGGIDLGQRTAAAILALRVADGSEFPEPDVGVDYFTSDLPGHWRQDPISLIPIALGAHWGACKPFVIEATDQFRVATPQT